MPDGLPADWQDRMVEMIRGAEDVDDAWFAGGPVCSPLDQIEIYVRQYRLRLFNALVDEIPGLNALLGDGAEPVLRRYLLEHPSESWTLNRVAHRLPEWLAEQPEGTEAAVEMAHLDRAVQTGFEAASGVAIEPAALAGLPRLRLQPHVSLLRVRHDVHALRSAVLLGREAPELREGDFPLVVFRRGIKMRHWVMPLPSWGILDEIRRGSTVPDAIDAIFAKEWATADQLTTEIGQWFKDYAERDLVELDVA
ncbi:MAG: DNA-binding domain-containing protein [Myxococcales bacterium]|nr:DNA-binding domain-containing protein [Myxococcales bacterium]